MALLAESPLHPRWPLLLFAGAGLEYIAAGLFAWLRRPSNGTGALLCLCGFSVLTAVSANTSVSTVVVVGVLTAQLPLATLFHVVLAFPSGRLPNRWSRRLVVASYLLNVLLHAPVALFSGEPTLPGVLSFGARPQLVLLASRAQKAAAAVLIALAVWELAQRLRRAEPQSRRPSAILYGYGGFTFVFLVFSANLLRPLLGLDPLALFVVQIIPIIGVPLAFVAGVLRGGFSRTRELDELAAWLATADDARPTLRDALRATLGDPSLDLLYWLPDRRVYVSEAGHPQALPEPGAVRAGVDVVTGIGRVGVITYDATLIADSEVVREAGRVVALALERERLTAELRAIQEALRESRARLVESADSERRRIARDLHDGLQARLVVLALRAGQLAERVGSTDRLAADVVQLRTDLESAIVELRRLVHGVLPALLIQRGLSATVEELLDALPIRSRLLVPDGETRVPPQLETAGYFVVAEALANTVKHAQAQEVSVMLTRSASSLSIEVCDDGIGTACLDSGTGLRGLVDRVEALGGRLDVDSVPGRGTRVRAELPCVL